MSDARQRRKLLAVASGGGHWIQLLRLRSAFSECDVVFATVDPAYQVDVQGAKFYSVPDATRRTVFRLMLTTWEIFWIIFRERPDAIISTGAAPGYIALRMGKLFGARSIWVDSIANSEELSMSGAMVGRYADLWLTQWPHLAKQGGPKYRGAVL